MASKPEEQEARVRPLATAGLSTHKIAAALGDMSQPTVVRVLKRINSGPHPIQAPGEPADSATEPFPDQQVPPPAKRHESRKIGWIIVGAMLILAALVVSAVWYRLAQAPAAPATQARIPACILYASDGRITTIGIAPHNHCGKGWQFLWLIPQGEH